MLAITLQTPCAPARIWTPTLCFGDTDATVTPQTQSWEWMDSNQLSHCDNGVTDRPGSPTPANSQFETRMGLEPIKPGFADLDLTIQPPCQRDAGRTRTYTLKVNSFRLYHWATTSLRKRWELNLPLSRLWQTGPHESLAPNGFQDRGHCHIALPRWCGETRTHNPPVKSRVL